MTIITGMGNIARPRTIDVLAAVLALAAYVLSRLLLFPGSSTDATPWWAPWFVALPVPVAFLPLIVPQPARQTARVVAATTLFCVYIISGLSVGAYYLPSLILMTISAMRRR